MKILASDFDGTLNQGGIDDTKREAIARWRATGNLFGIVSGRGVKDIKRLADESGVVCDFLLGDNGASVAKGDGTVLSEAMCDGSPAREILEYFFSVGADWCWVRPDPDIIVRNKLLGDGDITMEMLPTIEHFTQISTAFPALETTENVIAMLNEKYGENLNILQNGYCIDIVRRDINKAVGIYKLMEIVGAKYEDVITVGDNINDADMIREFRSYAMDNALPLIKELADYTTPSVTELILSELREK